MHVRRFVTFDLSPELAITEVPEHSDAKASFVRDEIPDELVVATRKRVEQAGLSPTEDEFNGLLAYVWPAMKKMKVRDDKYRAIREKNFTTKLGCEYFVELSIDELPGLTTPETTAVMLALSFEMGMERSFRSPGLWFSKEHSVSRQRSTA